MCSAIVCGQLHLFLQKSWPEEYAARAAEVEADEELGARTPHIAVEQHRWHFSKQQATWADRVRRSISSDQKFLEYDFLCSNPRCRSLLLHPLVLNCGHAVCADTCSPFHGKGPYACSRCQAVLTAQVAVCKQFEALLVQLFPERMQSRIEEVAALPAPGDCAPLAVASEDAGSAAKARLAPFNLVLSRNERLWSELQQGGIATVSCAAGGAGAAAGEKGTGLSAEQRRALRLEWDPSSRVASQACPWGYVRAWRGGFVSIAAGSAGAAAGNSTAQHRAHLIAALREGFVHPSICCDACGLFPIKGRRYKCTTCGGPPRYNLCGDCHDAGRHGTGRFNQPHHLAVCEALNPEMSTESLTNMMTYQFVGSGRRQLRALREYWPGSRGMGLTISMPPEDDVSSDSDGRSDSDDDEYLSCASIASTRLCKSADLLLTLLCMKGVELAQEEALSRYEQLMGPSGMEAILNDDGTLPLGALATLPGGGLTLRSLNLRRSRGQAPARDRLADTMPSRPAFAASQADGDALSEGAEGQEEELSEGGGDGLPSVQALFPPIDDDIPEEVQHQVDEMAAAAVASSDSAAAAAAVAGVGRGPTQEALEAFLEGPYNATMDAYAAAEATGDSAVLSAAEGACAEVQAELASMLAGEACSPESEVEAGGQAAGDAPETPLPAAERGTEQSGARPAGAADPGRGRPYLGSSPSVRASRAQAELESAREALRALTRQNAVPLQQLSASQAPSDFSRNHRPHSAAQATASRPARTQAYPLGVQGAAAHLASDDLAQTSAAGEHRAREDQPAPDPAPTPNIALFAAGSPLAIAAARSEHAGLQRPGTSMGPRLAPPQQPSWGADSPARDTADQAGTSPLAAGVAGNTEAGAPSGQPGLGHRGGQPRSPSPAAAREASLSPEQQEAAWAMAASGTLPAVVAHFGPGSMSFHIPEELVYMASDLDEAGDLGDSSDDDESGLGGDVSTTMLLLLCHALTRQRMPTV
eukprot:jgi/Astpho2/4333/fgenesh1_pg.00065_%23_18_t